jgi:hypothetical protein
VQPACRRAFGRDLANLAARHPEQRQFLRPIEYSAKAVAAICEAMPGLRRGAVTSCTQRPEQRFFRSRIEQRDIRFLVGDVVRLPQDIRDTLVCSRKTFRGIVRDERHYGVQSLVDIEQRARAPTAHCFEHFAADVPAVKVQRTQAVHDEIINLVVAIRAGLQRLLPYGCVDERNKIEFETALDCNARNAECRSPQTERVAVAGWFLAKREDAAQGIELVGDCEYLACT